MNMKVTRPLLSIAKIQIETELDSLKLFYSGIKLPETSYAYAKTLRVLIFYHSDVDIDRSIKRVLEVLQRHGRI